MSSDLTCFINISPSDGFLFSNSCNNDMLIYTETPEQNILIGTHSNIPAILRISSNQTSVYGNIVPYSNGTFSLGTPSLRFKDLFLTGATLDIGGVQLKLDESSNSLAVKTSDGEYTRIIAQEIQLGSGSNAVLVKIDPSNSSVQFLNLANSNGIVYSNISSLSQWSNEGPALFTENVNLGINTSNPQYTLDVNGDINFSGVFLENGTPYLEARKIYASSSNLAIGISNSEPGFTLGYDASFKSNVTIFGVLTVSNIQYVTSNITVLDTQIVNSNITTLNTLTFSNQTGSIILDSSNGNLGVGTSSPEHTLDVVGDINFTGTLKQNGKEYVGSQWSNIYNSVCILDSNVAIGTSNAETGFVSAVDSTFRSNVAFLDSLSLGASASIHHSQSNVGINTSNPNYTLDVSGDINFTGSLIQNGSLFKTSQWSNVSSNVFILDSNIGIGTSNPQFKLDVAGDINFTGDLIQNGAPYIGSQWTTLSSNVYIINSNIGIGLSNPTNALTVAGDVEFRSNIFLKNNTFVFRGLKVLKPDSNGSIANVTTTVNSVPGYTFSNNSLIFIGNQANFLINNSNAITLSSNTKVGIKNSNPTYDLDVAGDINLTGVLRQNGSPYVGSQWSNINNAVCILDSNVAIGTSNAETGFVSAVNATMRSNVTIRGNLAVTSNITMSNATGSVSIFSSNANIGIGKTNPQYKLDVQGDINFTGSLVQNGVVYGGGGSQTSTFSNVNFGNVHLTQSSNDLLVRNTQSNILLALSSNRALYGGAPVLFENGASNINVSTALYGNARIVGQSPSQEGSIYLPGTVGSYFYCSNAALDFNWNGSGGCTMEYWANFTSFSSSEVAGSVFMHGSPTNVSSVRDWDFGPNTSGNLNFFYFNYSGNGYDLATSTVLATNTWYHLAFTNDGGRIRLFINGVLSATSLVTGIPFISPSSASVGLVMGSFFSGVGKQCHMGNVRVIVGAVAYSTASTTIGTSVFTPSKSLGVHNSGTTVFLLKPQHGGKYIASSIDNSNAPAFTWSNDVNTGMYHPAQAQLGFTCGGSNVMTMSNTNVGIGLLNPSYKLDVTGDINATGLIRQNGIPFVTSQWSNSSAGAVFVMNSNVGINTSNPSYSLDVAGDSRLNGKLFMSNLVIGMSNNNLGIGTSNPTFKLEVNGSMYSSKISANTTFTNFDINLPLTGRIGNSGTDRAYFEMSNSGYDWLINARNIMFRTSNGGALSDERLRINDVGNVGIGISNPSYRLHVSGDIYATANVLAYSDSNYKDNIQVIPNALDKVDNITGYTFSFKEDPTSKRYAGLLAQEVQMVLPEVVSRDSNQQLSLAYGNTVALLVNAIKELRCEVKSLKENMSK